MKISSITARQIFDSRGYPTVECDVRLEDSSFGRAAVPSGASTGSREALELRDGGQAYGGKGVMQAVGHITDDIAPVLVGKSAENQSEIDTIMIELDGTESKSRLGANAILAVSLAVAKAAAASARLPFYAYVGRLAGNTNFSLPMPMLNILNGGRHAAGSTDIQEFMIIPVGADSFSEAMRMAGDVFHSLAGVLSAAGYATTVGDEGGYAPAVKGGTEEALAHIRSAVEKAGFAFGEEVVLALDIAASELADSQGYNFARARRHYTTDELIAWYEELPGQYPIVSIEDGLSENDWQGWCKLNQTLGGRLQLVGDDLLVTNTKLLEKAIQENAANAILIKPNQIGTLTETMNAVRRAQQAGWRTIVSHRSGETEDTTIAHLAVGLNAGQIKTGSFSRSERLAKYNELIRIAETLPSDSFTHPRFRS